MQEIWLTLIFLFNTYFSNCEEARENTVNALYEDVKEFLPCFYRECSKNNNTLWLNRCECGIKCRVLDTCCPDSIYRKTEIQQKKPSCRHMNDMNWGYLMIDKCPNGDDTKAALKQLCVEEGYSENDLIHQVPVTSLLSNVTYKNYFCFKCHETHEDFVFWSLLLGLSSKPDTEIRDESITLSYNNDKGAWGATFEKDGSMFEVEIVIEPNNMRPGTKCCLNLTSTCSEEWQDDETRNKCNAYTFVTEINKNGTLHAYRNPHCALCNFEDLSLEDCKGPFALFPSVHIPFSFTHLMDINGADGSKVGRQALCNETYMWDPLFKKCRLTGCIIPEYIIRDGACVPP